jgi:glycosyltransferase involved in cell wall biosynthesis
MNNYARSLAIKNVDVYLISVNDSLFSAVSWKEVEPHIYCLTDNQAVSKRRFSRYRIFGYLKIIKRIVGGIDREVTILNYPSTDSLLLDCCLLTAFKDNPLFCEVNEVRRFASDSTNTLRKRFYNGILERTYKRYTGIIFISKHIQEYYSSFAKQSIIVPILSDCSKPFSLTSNIDSLLFVFVGSIYFEKENLEELLEGFCLFAQEHPDAELKLYGIMPDNSRKRLYGIIDKNESGNRISYCGLLQHSEVPNILSAASGLILPRTNNKQNYYGFSTKLSEYAVSGTPIIMTNTGVVSDFFEDCVNCLMLDGYDRYSFKNKFDEFSRMDVTDRCRLAENAYRLAQDKFDYRIYSEKLYDFLIGKE